MNPFYLVLLALCVVRGDYLEQRKVVFLDKTMPSSGLNNYLFRGNEPKISVNDSDVFAYELLGTYMANATRQAGFTLPSSYYLIDIKYVYSTIDPFEEADIKLETAFFKANPMLGEFSTHVILGDVTDPSLLPKATANAKAATLPTWQDDDLPNYIPSIYKLLYTPRTQPTVIYFHCECGCDRTGEIGASYALKYLNMTYPQALGWDEKIAGRLILPNHQFAIDWYCFYLNVVEGMQLLNC